MGTRCMLELIIWWANHVVVLNKNAFPSKWEESNIHLNSSQDVHLDVTLIWRLWTFQQLITCTRHDRFTSSVITASETWPMSNLPQSTHLILRNHGKWVYTSLHYYFNNRFSKFGWSTWKASIFNEIKTDGFMSTGGVRILVSEIRIFGEHFLDSVCIFGEHFHYI